MTTDNPYEAPQTGEVPSKPWVCPWWVNVALGLWLLFSSTMQVEGSTIWWFSVIGGYLNLLTGMISCLFKVNRSIGDLSSKSTEVMKQATETIWQLREENARLRLELSERRTNKVRP